MGKFIAVVTVMLRFTELCTPLASVICTVKLVGLASDVGVPEMVEVSPVDGVTDNHERQIRVEPSVRRQASHRLHRKGVGLPNEGGVDRRGRGDHHSIVNE